MGGYDLSSLRALDQLLGAGPRQQHAGIPAGVFRDRTEAWVLQSSYAMAENVFAVTQSEVEAMRARRDLGGRPQLSHAHSIVRVAEGTAGALPFTSSGRCLPDHEVRIVVDSGADRGDG